MKTIITFLMLLILAGVAHAQEGNLKLTPEEAEDIPNKVNKGINFGISLGFNRVFDDLVEAKISPIDNTVIISDLSKSSFLISTGLSVPLTKWKKERTANYRRMENGEGVGPVYYVSTGWCFVATVNLVTFNSAANGSLFNAKIDGGLGLGYRINEELQLALTYEMISYRQPREFVLDYEGETIVVNDEVLTALSEDDSNYFVDRYLPSVSFKFFYLISSNKTK